jgi:GT2 family glycosyltransferase
VVIATRDRPGELRRCLDALADQVTTRVFDVVVVNDGREPLLVDPKWEDRLTQLSSGGVGPARARNAGVKRATAPIVMFTDDDTIPSPSWVEAACAALERDLDAAATEGPTISPPFDHLYEHSVEGGPGAYITANIAYRRTVLLEVGGLDAAFPSAHCEDLDLAFRVLAIGSITWTPEMEVIHPPKPAALKALVLRGRMTAESECLLFRRYPDRYPRPWGVSVELSVIIRLILLWAHRGRIERRSLLSSPRRALRFLVVAVGQVAVASIAMAKETLRAPRRARVSG